jgi:hypothetical protein
MAFGVFWPEPTNPGRPLNSGVTTRTPACYAGPPENLDRRSRQRELIRPSCGAWAYDAGGRVVDTARAIGLTRRLPESSKWPSGLGDRQARDDSIAGTLTASSIGLVVAVVQRQVASWIRINSFHELGVRVQHPGGAIERARRASRLSR